MAFITTHCHHPRVLGSVCEWKGGVEFDYDFLLRQNFPKGMHYHAKHDYEFFPKKGKKQFLSEER